MKYISIFVLVTAILGGGLFFYTNKYKKSTPAPIATANQNTVAQASNTLETIIEQSTSTPTSTQSVTKENNTTNTQSVAKVVAKTPIKVDPRRASAVIELQDFLTDWKGKYKTECTGKEMTNECTIWRAGIQKLETTCFQNELTGAEVTKCGESVLKTAFQSAFWSKAAEQMMSTTTKSTIDGHGVDLARLSEGQTVKVFKTGPTEETPYVNEATVTYIRTGDIVKITEVIVNSRDKGYLSYSRTVSLK